MMEDLITDLRNMTGMGRFARSEVREILAYLESVGWLSEPKAPEPAGELIIFTKTIDPATLHEPMPTEAARSDAAFDAMLSASEFNPHE